MPTSPGAAPAQAADPRHSERMLLVTLAAIQVTHVLDFMILMPLGPQLMRVLAISPAQFSLLVSAYSVSAAVSGLVCALHVDRFDRKHALLGLYAGFAVATLLCALAPNFPLLLAARLVAGAFGGVVGATVYSIVGDAFPDSRRGAATGVVASAFSLSAVAGVPLGLLLANLFGWRAPFALLAVLTLPILLAARQWVPPLRTHVEPGLSPRRPLQRMASLLTEPGHLRALALMTTLLTAGFFVIPFISPYIVANAGVREQDLPWIYFCGGLATVFTSRAVGRLADRHGKRQVFIVVGLLSVVPTLLLTNLPRVPLAVVLCVTTVFMVLGNGRWVCALALVTANIRPQVRGSFLNVSFAVQQIATGVATLLAGRIIGVSADGELTRYPLVGLIAVAAALSAVGLAWRWKPATKARLS
jgi:predicted MFS family arabinose efflux permease